MCMSKYDEAGFGEREPTLKASRRRRMQPSEPSVGGSTSLEENWTQMFEFRCLGHWNDFQAS
jgi:hypothetical protein